MMNNTLYAAIQTTLAVAAASCFLVPIGGAIYDSSHPAVACQSRLDIMLSGGRFYPGERVIAVSCYGYFGTKVADYVQSTERAGVIRSN